MHRTTDCVDLEGRFGHRYQIGYEDADAVATSDPWLKTVVCKEGHISPAGGEKLWACIDGIRSKAARAVRNGSVPATVKMDGDDGINAEFLAKDWKVMFALMGARKKR